MQHVLDDNDQLYKVKFIYFRIWYLRVVLWVTLLLYMGCFRATSGHGGVLLQHFSPTTLHFALNLSLFLLLSFSYVLP